MKKKRVMRAVKKEFPNCLILHLFKGRMSKTAATTVWFFLRGSIPTPEECRAEQFGNGVLIEYSLSELIRRRVKLLRQFERWKRWPPMKYAKKK